MSAGSALARSASRGAAASMSGQVVRLLLQTAGVVLLARLLAPQDYGLIAEVLVVVGLGEILRDFGLSSAAVQAKHLSDAERSNLFWANTAVGVVLGLATVAASPLVALVYQEPRLVALTCALSGTFLLNGVATQMRADLNRRLAFGRLSLAEIVGQAAGLGVGVVMALTGAGYWSLAGQQLAGAAVTLVALWWATRFRPARYDRGTSIRRFLGFGADVAGAQLLGYASKNTDTLVIGAVLGTVALGFYNRAFQLVTLPLAQINAPATRVALAVLSQLRDDRTRYGRYLLAGQTVMLHLLLAVFSWSGALAVPLFALVLGEKWVPSAGLFQILAVAGVFSTAGYATYWVFLSKGLTRSQLWWQLVSRPVVVLIVLSGIAGGVQGVATAYAAASALMWVLGLVWIRRVSDAPAGALLTNALRAMAGYGLAAAAVTGTVRWSGAEGPAALAIGTGVWAAVVALLLLWPAFRRDLQEMVRAVSRARSSRAPARAPRSPVPQG